MAKKEKVPSQQKGDALKETADGLGVPVEQLLQISLEVMRSGTPVLVVPVDGQAVVEKKFVDQTVSKP